jgi:hypothetical protein
VETNTIIHMYTTVVTGERVVQSMSTSSENQRSELLEALGGGWIALVTAMSRRRGVAHVE